MVGGSAEYADMLLDIGSGEVKPVVEDYIALDNRIVSDVSNIADFVDEVFCDGLKTVHAQCFDSYCIYNMKRTSVHDICHTRHIFLLENDLLLVCDTMFYVREMLHTIVIKSFAVLLYNYTCLY